MAFLPPTTQPQAPPATLWRTVSIGELPPYLPQDNGCRLETGVLRVQAKALQALLGTKFPMFASHALYNPQVGAFLDGYLNHARRPFELAADRHAGMPKEDEGSLAAVEAVRTALHRLVFLVYLRLLTSEDEQQQVPGFAALAKDRNVLDLPRVLDLCNLYGFTDPALLTRLLEEGAFRLFEANLLAQLAEACRSIQDVLQELHRAVASPSSSTGDAESDALEYLADVTGGLSRLVQAVSLTALTLAASPDLFLALRRTYGVLAARNKEADGNGEMATSSRDKQARRRGFYARFVCRCSLALLNAVVDGLIAHAPVHEGALEALFTLLSQLVQAKGDEENKEEEDEQQGDGKSSSSRGLLSDCVKQRNGLVVRLQKFVSAASAGSRQGQGQNLDTSGVAYLVELLKNSVGGAQGESAPPRGVFMSPGSHQKEEEWGEGETEKGRVRGPDIKAMIQEVRQVCPGLGEGFVHACLAVMDYNTNMVVNALLEGGALPYPLDTLDRTLPSPMAVDKRRQKDGGVEDEARDEEFIAHQKAYLRQMERDAEEDAYLLQEYDDDFDDQFQAEGMTFSRDSAREDFESVKKYNSLVKKEEEEDRFWQEMRLEQPGLPKVEGRVGDDEDDEDEEEGEEGKEETKQGRGFGPDARRGRPRGGGGGGGGIARGRGGGRAEGGRGGRGGGGRGRGGDGGGGEGRGGGRGGEGGRGAGGGRGGGTGTAGGGGTAGPLSALARRRKEKQKHLRANHNRKAQAARKSGSVG
jgi:hypothetical protein